MAKKPEDRFSDPAALANELHAVAAEGSREGWATPPDNWSLTQMIHGRRSACRRDFAARQSHEDVGSAQIAPQIWSPDRRHDAGVCSAWHHSGGIGSPANRS